MWSEALEWVGISFAQTNLRSELLPLVLAPQPCVYRSRALTALEAANRRWRLVFSSHSYAGTIAAVRAGMGITVLPKNMIPKDLTIVSQPLELPDLADTHICLLKHDSTNSAVNSFESFVMGKLKGGA